MPSVSPGIDGEGDVFHRMDDAVAGVEAGGEVPDVEQGHDRDNAA